MHTRNSPPQSASEDTTALPTSARCHWSEEDETELISFLKDCKGEGDSSTSASPEWNAVAGHLEKFRKKGGQKTAHACSSKWNRVRDTTDDIDYPLTIVLAQGDLLRRQCAQKVHIWF
jgi:hypothetical protein